MYNVSSDFLTAVQQPGRVFHSQATVKKTGNADVALTDAQIINMKLSATSISGEDFEIGTTCAAELDVEIANLDGSLSGSSFQDASITAAIGVVLADGQTVEYCPLGVFFVDSISRTETSIKLVCYDAMVQLEALYQSSLSYPATLLQIAQDIAGKAGLTLANTSFPNAGFTVATAPSLAGITLRAALSRVAEAAASFARINRDGELELAFYTAAGTNITAGNYYSLTHDEQPRAAITQVLIRASDTDPGVSQGTAGNTYTITGNPLLLNNPGGALPAIFNQVNNFSYMPFTANWQGNPASMAGDVIAITDRDGNTYGTVLTECDTEYAGGVSGTAGAKALTDTGQSYPTASPVASSVTNAVNSAQSVTADVANIKNVLAGNITADNIAAGAITADRLQAGTITAASGIIGNAAIGTANIQDAAIVTAKIADATITGAKITNASIGSAQIGNAAVGTAQIAAGAITNALIGTGAVQTAQIADGSITDAKVVSLTANKLTAGTIDASKITVTNLNCANLTVGTINGTQIGSGAITGGNIAPATITDSLIAATTITGDKLVADSITAREIDSATITTNEIAANTITAGNIAGGTITATQIASGTITGGNIAAGTITGSNIAAGSITADKIVTANLYAQALNPSGSNYVTCGSVSIAEPPSDTVYTGYGLLLMNTGTSTPVVSITYDNSYKPALFNCLNGFQFAAIDSGQSHCGSMSMSLSVTPTGGFTYQGAGGNPGFTCDTSGTFTATTMSATHYYAYQTSGTYTLGGTGSSRWNIMPVVDGSGVMEIGQYIDFHESNGDTADYSVRLSSSGGVLTTGQSMSIGGRLTLSGTTYPQISGNGTILALANSSVSSAGVIIEGGDFRVATDGQLNLGTASKRWAQIYSTVSSISTSDANYKNSIAEIDAGRAIAFLGALRPVTYRFNDGTSGRTHWGLIAQDVEQEMAGLGMSTQDFAGFIKSPKQDDDGNDISAVEGYIYGLRYEEFISPLIAAVQALHRRVAALDDKG